MPKLKSHSGTKKRVLKITKSGKVKKSVDMKTPFQGNVYRIRENQRPDPM